MAYKKTVMLVLLFILLCGLTACGTPDLPEAWDFAGSAEEEYYIPNGYEVETVQVDQETVNKKDKVAERICTITAKSVDGSFQAIDSWSAHYFYNDGWKLNEKALLSTEYELLEDLPEETCTRLLNDALQEDVQCADITTNRDNFSAQASYSYESHEEIADGYGSLDVVALGEAEFTWDEINRWNLANYRDDRELTYNAAFTIFEQSEYYTRGSEKFSLRLDVNIENNVPSLEVKYYQGTIDTIGRLSISNPQLVIDENQPDTFQVTFDFSRSIDDVENDENYYYIYSNYYYPAEGSGYIEVHSNGTATLFFNNWTHNGYTNDWIKGIFNVVLEQQEKSDKVSQEDEA